MATTAQAGAGSFLIARGRRQGYRLLLVPHFVVTADEHQQLVDNVQSTSEHGPPRIAYADGSLALVYRARTLRAEDLDDDGRPVRDEHGRPLILLYGFATRAARVDQVDETDLDRAWHDAISAYRTFLSHESAFQAVPSSRFVLASLITPPPAYPHSRGHVEPGPLPRRLLVAVGVAVVAVLAVVLGVLRPWQSSSEPITARVQAATTLASEPRRECAPPACQSRGDVTGQRLQAVCQIHGDPMPDGQAGSSDLWYGVDWNGEIAYLPEVWVQPRYRGGLSLPSCVATTR